MPTMTGEQAQKILTALSSPGSAPTGGIRSSGLDAAIAPFETVA